MNSQRYCDQRANIQGKSLLTDAQTTNSRTLTGPEDYGAHPLSTAAQIGKAAAPHSVTQLRAGWDDVTTAIDVTRTITINDITSDRNI